MTDRRFRLASVLRVRRLQEESARQRAALADLRARAAHDSAQQKERSVLAAASAGEAREATRYLAARGAVLVAAADARSAQRAAADDAVAADIERSGWFEHRRRVKVLESLEQTHDDRVRRDDDRREQHALDEQALVLWRRPR